MDTSSRQKWEYSIQYLPSFVGYNSGNLNKLGQEGWELVSLIGEGFMKHNFQ